MTDSSIEQAQHELLAPPLYIQPQKVQQALLRPDVLKLFSANKDQLYTQRTDFLQSLEQVHGIKLTELKLGFVEGIMSVDERTTRPHVEPAILHGGASITFACALGRIGSELLLKSGLKLKLISSQANHLRMVTAGNTVQGQACLLHFGSRIHIWDVRLLNKEQKLVCLVRLTYKICQEDSE